MGLPPLQRSEEGFTHKIIVCRPVGEAEGKSNKKQNKWTKASTDIRENHQNCVCIPAAAVRWTGEQFLSVCIRTAVRLRTGSSNAAVFDLKRDSGPIHTSPSKPSHYTLTFAHNEGKKKTQQNKMKTLTQKTHLHQIKTNKQKNPQTKF